MAWPIAKAADARGRSSFWLPAVASLALLASCAGYQSQALEAADTAAVLASPDREVLVQQAAKLSHPAMRPVSIDFAQPLTADAVAAIAVLANPDLRALRLQQGIANAQVFAAGLLPDPQLSLGFDQLLAPSDQGLAAAFAGSLTLDLLGALVTRDIEQAAARTSAEQVRLDIAWQEWSTAGSARVLVERVSRLRVATKLADTAAQTAEHALSRSLVAAERGDLKADEVEIRRIAASDATARALAAQRDADAARQQLNQLLGLKPDEQLVLADTAPLTLWIAPDSEALFAQARKMRLDLQALAKGYDAQQIAVQRAVFGQYPRLGITLNRARDTSHVHTFGPAITLDLPIFGRGPATVTAAKLGRERLRAEYAARLFQTRADIAAIITALARDERARRNTASQLPALDAIAARFEAAAARGDVSAPVAEAARAAAVDKRLAWLALDQSCAEQRLALALAVGEPLADPSASTLTSVSSHSP